MFYEEKAEEKLSLKAEKNRHCFTVLLVIVKEVEEEGEED